MSTEQQFACIEYLKGDVMGLKELSQNLNKSCFDTFKTNLYKFLSTLQLTYAVWVNQWYKESTNTIYIQTAEQEKFFRGSFYGGRLTGTKIVLLVLREMLSLNKILFLEILMIIL